MRIHICDGISARALQSAVNQHAPDTGSSFMQRLGYYAMGISLGLLILGWFQIQKMRARQANPPLAPAQVDPGMPVDAEP